jgi:hypothetical protein
MRRLWMLTAVLSVMTAACALAGDDAASILTPEKKAHWAWRTPRRPALPMVANAAWVRNSVDAFVLAKLKAKGLHPAPPADAVTLLRRLHLDLIGLPPTPAEVDDFLYDCKAHGGAERPVQDNAPSSVLSTEYSALAVPPAVWTRQVNRLLASPHYGERWGRRWLDLARYAESNGYEHDEIRPEAWRYRDYVIRSFNANKPYDRFILEQLAGDELFEGDADARIATGFNLLGPDMVDSSNQAQRRQNTLDDMTETAGLAFLGLTIGCARCHDHKFEPILQADFFRMQAFFAPAQFRTDIPVADRETLAAFAAGQKRYQALIQPTLDALAELEGPYRAKVFEKKLTVIAEEARQAHRTPPEKRTARQQSLVDRTNRLLTVTAKEAVALMTPDDRARHESLEKTLKNFDSHKPRPLPVTTGLQDAAGKLPKTRVLIRGELNHPGEEVHPAWPVVLSPEHRETRPTIAPPRPETTGRRAALAKWITDPEHPLTARVMVNRLWQHHFGKGLVATPSDFGIRGERPTHPELLDWLATEFIASGWDIKHMHRLMATSATYQQTSAPFSRGSKNRGDRSPAESSPKPSAASPRFSEPGLNDVMEIDPDNTLLWRMNRRRLEGEIIRDSLLAVSGRLNPKMGGPSFRPPLPAEARVSAKEWQVTADADEHMRRSVYIFARRNLRHPFLATFDLPDSNQSCAVRESSTTGPQALALLNSDDVTAAARALAGRLTKSHQAADEQIGAAFRHAFSRGPSADELEWSRELLKGAPLEELCRALLNANEFVYID